MADKGLGRWQIGKSLIECNRYKLQQQIDCDVVFKLINPVPTYVKAHKYMLVTRSPVFEAMFSGNFKEMSEVTITDVESGAFREMLRYIYTDEVDICPDNALHVLAAAKKYLLDGLENICTSFLQDNICKDNACMLLDQSQLFGAAELKNECLDLIAKKTQEVFATGDFLTISQSGLLEILKQDNLNVETESTVYAACIEWAKTKSGKQATDIELREILGPCLYQIRFCAMKAEEFANTGGKSSILNGEEKNTFYSFILTKENQGQLNKWGFNLKLRRPESGFCQVFKHIQIFQRPFTFKHGNNFGIKDYLQVEIDNPILMTGVTVLGCTKGGQYNITLTMSHQQSEQMNHEPRTFVFSSTCTGEQQRKSITAIDNSQYLAISLDKAYKMIPGYIYNFQISAQNSQHPIYKAYEPQYIVCVQGVNFKFQQYNPGILVRDGKKFITGILFKKL